MTLAHSAVVPPMMRVSRGRLVPSALVVGSMAPDFASVVHLSSDRTLSHTVPGLFVFCLPVTLAVLVVWHGLIKRPLASLLPPRLATVASVAGRSFSFWPAPKLLAICGSALAGSVSHIAWDGFTHDGGFFVDRIDLLRQPIHWHGLAVYDVLQYGSGLLGLVVLGFWWHRLAEGQSRTADLTRPAPVAVAAAPARIRWTAVSAISVLSASAGAANSLRAAAQGWPTRDVLSHAAYGTLAGLAAAIVLVGVVLSRRRA